MTIIDSLAARMKRYEQAARTTLTWSLPILIRVDGKSFHTWTSSLDRPFDVAFMRAMNVVALELCSQLHGAKLAFVQSDEITVLLYPWGNHDAEPWFGNQVQKMVSVSAGIASASMTIQSVEVHGSLRPAVFDARVYAVPPHDVVNAFIWRQQDATRNSLQMLAQSLYRQDELTGKNKSQLHELCWTAGRNWDALPTGQKQGRCIRRSDEGVWHIDQEPPRFTADRAYIEALLRPRAL